MERQPTRQGLRDRRHGSNIVQVAAVRKTLESQGYEAPGQYTLKVDWSSLDLMSCPEFQQLRRRIADNMGQAVGTLDRDRLQA